VLSESLWVSLRLLFSKFRNSTLGSQRACFNLTSVGYPLKFKFRGYQILDVENVLIRPKVSPPGESSPEITKMFINIIWWFNFGNKYCLLQCASIICWNQLVYQETVSPRHIGRYLLVFTFFKSCIFEAAMIKISK
jgi:hypothetical protein